MLMESVQEWLLVFTKLVQCRKKLENWKGYTGHLLRRTSSILFIDCGGDLTCLKRHGGWKSSTVAEGYIEESRINKENTARKILQTDKKAQVPVQIFPRMFHQPLRRIF